jgi:hypothetical protein
MTTIDSAQKSETVSAQQKADDAHSPAKKQEANRQAKSQKSDSSKDQKQGSVAQAQAGQAGAPKSSQETQPQALFAQPEPIETKNEALADEMQTSLDFQHLASAVVQLDEASPEGELARKIDKALAASENRLSDKTTRNALGNVIVEARQFQDDHPNVDLTALDARIKMAESTYRQGSSYSQALDSQLQDEFQSLAPNAKKINDLMAEAHHHVPEIFSKYEAQFSDVQNNIRAQSIALMEGTLEDVDAVLDGKHISQSDNWISRAYNAPANAITQAWSNWGLGSGESRAVKAEARALSAKLEDDIEALKQGDPSVQLSQLQDNQKKLLSLANSFSQTASQRVQDSATVSVWGTGTLAAGGVIAAATLGTILSGGSIWGIGGGAVGGTTATAGATGAGTAAATGTTWTMANAGFAAGFANWFSGLGLTATQGSLALGGAVSGVKQTVTEAGYAASDSIERTWSDRINSITEDASHILMGRFLGGQGAWSSAGQYLKNGLKIAVTDNPGGAIALGQLGLGGGIGIANITGQGLLHDMARPVRKDEAGTIEDPVAEYADYRKKPEDYYQSHYDTAFMAPVISNLGLDVRLPEKIGKNIPFIGQHIENDTPLIGYEVFRYRNTQQVDSYHRYIPEDLQQKLYDAVSEAPQHRIDQDGLSLQIINGKLYSIEDVARPLTREERIEQGYDPDLPAAQNKEQAVELRQPYSEEKWWGMNVRSHNRQDLEKGVSNRTRISFGPEATGTEKTSPWLTTRTEMMLEVTDPTSEGYSLPQSSSLRGYIGKNVPVIGQFFSNKNNKGLYREETSILNAKLQASMHSVVNDRDIAGEGQIGELDMKTPQAWWQHELKFDTKAEVKDDYVNRRNIVLEQNQGADVNLQAGRRGKLSMDSTFSWDLPRNLQAEFDIHNLQAGYKNEVSANAMAQVGLKGAKQEIKVRPEQYFAVDAKGSTLLRMAEFGLEKLRPEADNATKDGWLHTWMRRGAYDGVSSLLGALGSGDGEQSDGQISGLEQASQLMEKFKGFEDWKPEGYHSVPVDEIYLENDTLSGSEPDKKPDYSSDWGGVL